MSIVDLSRKLLYYFVGALCIIVLGVMVLMCLDMIISIPEKMELSARDTEAFLEFKEVHSFDNCVSEKCWNYTHYCNIETFSRSVWESQRRVLDCVDLGGFQ